MMAALAGLLYVFFGNEPLVIYGALVILGVVETALIVRHCLQYVESTNRLGVVLLVVWLGVALYLTLFFRLGGQADSKVMNTPFLGLSKALEQRSLELLGHFSLNVLLFMPLEYLLPNIDPAHLRRAGGAILGGLFLSTVIEGIQMLAKLGCCDIGDIIANTLGAALGYLIYHFVWQVRKDSRL